MYNVQYEVSKLNVQSLRVVCENLIFVGVQYNIYKTAGHSAFYELTV